MEYLCCTDRYDPDVVAILLRYSAYASMSLMHMFTIRDACGILGNAGRFRGQDVVLGLLILQLANWTPPPFKLTTRGCCSPPNLKQFYILRVRAHVPVSLPDHVNDLPLPMHDVNFLTYSTHEHKEAGRLQVERQRPSIHVKVGILMYCFIRVNEYMLIFVVVFVSRVE